MTELPRVVHAREQGLDAAGFRRILVESGMDRIRPVEDFYRRSGMAHLPRAYWFRREH